MAQSKTISVPIQGGMREDVSELSAAPGTITYAQNVRFGTVGEVEARPGTVALSAAVSASHSYSSLVSAGLGALASMGNGFFVGTQGFGFRYDHEQERLNVGGSYSNAEPLGVFNVAAGEDFGQGTIALPYPLSQVASNGYVVTVYSCGNGQGGVGPSTENIMLVHVHTDAGVPVTSARYNSVTAAWVVLDGSDPTGNTVVLLQQDTTTGVSGRIITLSATGATIGAASAVLTLAANTSFWAACDWPGVGWAVAYLNAPGVMTISKRSGVTSIGSQTFLVTGDAPVSTYADATHVYVGWREGFAPSDAMARVYDTALSLTSGGSVTLESAGTNYGPPLFGTSNTASAAMYAVSLAATSDILDTSVLLTGTLTSAGDVQDQSSVYQCNAASRPFGNGYIWVRAGGFNGTVETRFHRHLLLDFMGLRIGDAVGPPVVALATQLFTSGTASAYPGGWYQQHLCAPVQLDSGHWVVGIPRMVREEDADGANDRGLALAEWLRFRVGGQRQVSLVGSEPLVAGHPVLAHSNTGTRHYDSFASASNEVSRDGLDLGFPLPPAFSVSTSNSTGSLTSGATYQWRCVLERIDYLGRRWRSAPSDVISITLGAAIDTATIAGRANVRWLRAGWPRYHGSQFVLHVYRTLANGSTFYRTTPPQGAPSSSTSGTFAFTDGLSDSTLELREILYTDGGVLQNDCPPSCRFIRCTEDRVWLGGLWETEQVQSSKILVPGEPPQFSDSPAFRVVLPEPCTGLAIQDGIVVAFARSAIYAIQGAGPSDQGQGAWDTPRCVTKSTGCVAHHSIVETSAGIFFQSGQGIEMIPRGLGEPVFVGMPVQSQMYDAAGEAMRLVVSAAVVTTSQSRTVRFLLDSATTMLVFDLDTQAWSVDTHTSIMGIVDTDGGAVMPLTTMSGAYGFLREDISEDRDSVGNNPAEIASSVEWADLRPFGVAGQGKFHSAIGLFAEKASPSAGYRSGNATISLTVDRFTETGKVFNMSALEANDYMRHVPASDAGTSGRLALTTTVGGWRFAGWTVEVAENGGGRRMGETEQG